MTFAELLNSRLASQRFESQSSFRQHLNDRHGVAVTDSAVSMWTTGARVPGTSHLVAILDALVVPESERGLWLNACASHRRDGSATTAA